MFKHLIKHIPPQENKKFIIKQYNIKNQNKRKMIGFKMVKEFDEDKAFEQKLKGKMGWKCSCSLDIIDKKNVPSRRSSLKVAIKFLRPIGMLNIVLDTIKRGE